MAWPLRDALSHLLDALPVVAPVPMFAVRAALERLEEREDVEFMP